MGVDSSAFEEPKMELRTEVLEVDEDSREGGCEVGGGLAGSGSS